MNAHDYPGILVVFDGIDGAGKTTQVRRLEAALASVGERVIVSKEPTDGPWGAKLRASATSGRLPFDEELTAFIEDRQEHLATKVIPALEAGAVVILDRYFYSTIAYQGLRAGGISPIEARIRRNVVEPDVAYLLDVPPTLATARIQARDGAANHFEKIEDLIQIDRLFREIAQRDESIVRIDGSVSEQAVFDSLLKHFVEGPFKRKRCAKDYGCDDPLHCTPRLTSNCTWWERAKALLGRPETI
ncbi:dTMP kinase [Thauera humireducens]|uniref:Thymidylate kinase n=1 Tax=Thauera humireducens TaxID=1134435 RepID=A0A127K390_9RHOO|nr:dTMP kinase [Thauera humireducens]AMO36431.1 hypothetical protein AC731_005470 [Thauera humireducens]